MLKSDREPVNAAETGRREPVSHQERIPETKTPQSISLRGVGSYDY